MFDTACGWLTTLWPLLSTGAALVAIGACSVYQHEMRRAFRERDRALWERDDWKRRYLDTLGDPRLEDDPPVRRMR